MDDSIQHEMKTKHCNVISPACMIIWPPVLSWHFCQEIQFGATLFFPNEEKSAQQLFRSALYVDW